MQYSNRVVTRYKDAYRVARTTVSLGSSVKAVGMILAALVVMGGLLASEAFRSGYFPLLTALPVAVLLWLGSWVLGVLVSSQGQILKANLDDAVNTSPFLSDVDRAQAMSLH